MGFSAQTGVLILVFTSLVQFKSTQHTTQTVEFCRSGNRHYPRLLREQPCQSDLCFRRVLLLSDLSQRVHQCLVCFPGFCREARNDVAEISLVELRLV